MNIVIMGPKGAGKSAVGALLAETAGFQTIETDRLIEDLYEERAGTRLACRQVVEERGEAFFRALERDAAKRAAKLDWHVVVTGGSVMLDPDSRRLLRNGALLVYLGADCDTLWERATRDGVPPWCRGEHGRQAHDERVALREEVLRPFADITVDTTDGAPEDVAAQVLERLGEELSILGRAANTYGEVIRATTFGESHGKAIGVVLDGLRPGIAVSEEDIQRELDRRRPGQSKLVTRRNEADRVEILSGVFEGKTTGAPIALIIYNKDQKPKHYEALRDLFRPGHADFTFYRKYGIRDHRGGGRSSGRETACRVAGGAVARHILAQRGVRIVAHAVEIAGVRAERCDYDANR